MGSAGTASFRVNALDGAPLGSPWASLGASLGLFGALLGPPFAPLVFSCENLLIWGSRARPCKNHCFFNEFGWSGPLGSVVFRSVGPVWATWAPPGSSLGRSLGHFLATCIRNYILNDAVPNGTSSLRIKFRICFRFFDH